ncbi:hypothetical protein [Kriegella aquimaris]|uniref:Glycerophosphoryl diester phosphodiesterase membrane domain-containing protein n=1 Tax=Kriegella aquimaris TaxID=192904 RepID=A0A1G9WBC6_9FLAO|nr:hypothetical protein [Kriegella aquimaris]SDM81759.1 hypothetical protein SAMN04488514_11536 [Kriegella aquimaris]
MKSNYIEFKRERELGEILSDTFAFLRDQFKPFIGVFFKIVGPYLLVMMISLGLYLYFIGNSFSMMVGTSSEIPNILLMIPIGLLYMASLVTVYVMSQSTVLHYIKSYANGKGEIDIETIKSGVYETFWRFIGLGFLVALSVGFGLMICLIPGIYLWVPLSLSFSIMVYNGMGASESFSYSFTLVRDYWWITFATLLVIVIIVAIASYAFAVPSMIYNWMKMGIFSGEMDAESMMDVFQDPIYILLNMIGTLAQFLLNIISIVAGVFIYFNLNEKKNFTGTYERIQNLGETPS